MLNDFFIVRKIKEGDIKVFEGVFRRYYSPLCLYAAGITGRTDIAEEIIQDLFYVLWRDREGLQIFTSLNGYLYGAVRNRSLQYCEHRQVRDRHKDKTISEKVEISDSTPEEQLEYKELEELINKTLGKMPERRLRIFRMQRFEGKKYAEIAKILSISIKTVEAEMTKALQSLRKEIENYTQIL